MATHTEHVAKLYASIVVYEQNRLPSYPMEREITLLTIKQYLRGSCKIADIGGGPGVVSFALADRGHSVDLRDLTPELIDLAQATQDERKADGKPLLHSIGVHNALERSGLPEESYDGVLLLGPLYHLMNEYERVTAVRNALDLTKKGGVVFCAFITVAAHLRDIAMKDADRLVNSAPFYGKYLDDGRYEKYDESREFHVQSYHTDTTGIKNFFARNFSGHELIDLRATEGLLGGGLDAKLQNAAPETVKVWAETMFERYSTKEYLGCADHLLAVIRK